MTSFITYRLCDNDFSEAMRRAATFIVEAYGAESLKDTEADVFFRREDRQT